MMFIRFEGANMRETDEGREYHPRGPISVNPDHVTGYYDHTIMAEGFKIRVMEDYVTIDKRLNTQANMYKLLDDSQDDPAPAGW